MTVRATEYHAGLAKTYGSLNLFFGSVTLVDGDVVILFNDDDSLKSRSINLAGKTITIMSDDDTTPRVISMNTPGTAVTTSNGGILNLGGGTSGLILDGITFKNGKVDLNVLNGRGGAIYSSGTLTIDGAGDYAFEGNSSLQQGGAIYAVHLTFSGGSNYSFKENTTASFIGGTIYADSTLTFNGDGNYTFEENSAAQHAGVIFARDTLTFNGNGDYTFNKNSAGNSGGGIFSESVLVTFNGNGDYVFTENSAGNYGGAMCVKTLTFNGDGDYTFNKNSAGWNGGAILIHDTLTFNGIGDYVFVKNSADVHGGAIWAENLMFNGPGDYRFTENSADGSGGAILVARNMTFSGIGDYTFEKNTADEDGGALLVVRNMTFSGNGDYTFEKNSAGREGGAIYAYTTLEFNGAGGYTFNENAAVGHGGAIYTRDTLTFGGSGDYTFKKNTAVYGGAVYARGALVIENTGDYAFTNNSADQGGAIYADKTLDFNGRGDYLFMNNSSGFSGGAILCNGDMTFDNTGNYVFRQNSTGQLGGAMIVNGLLTFQGAGDYLFVKNSAGSYGGAIFVSSTLTFDGTGNHVFELNSAGQHGGAIFTYNALSFDGQGSYAFDQNQALNGNGGAIYATGPLEIASGATFTRNHARTLTTGEMTKGLGGAVFIDTADRDITFTLNALNTANGDILFQGNTMNPGNTGVIPNSVFFGNSGISLGYGSDGTVDAVFDVEEGAQFRMLDPMASQKDDLQNLSSATCGNLAVNIDKTGLGTWVLAGHNDMQSATNWQISEGKLFLVYEKYGSGSVLTPVHINLANTTNAMLLPDDGNAKFTLKSDAGFIVEPGNTPHFITGQSITLEAGSTSGVDGFIYGPVLPLGRHVLLTLDVGSDGTLDNQQDIVQATNGTVSVGIHDYEYELLQWENFMHDLVFNITKRTLNPEKGGVPAISGPGEIVLHSRNQTFDAVDQRSRSRFGFCWDRAFPVSHRPLNTLWATPSYFSATRSQGDKGAFDLSAFGTTFGYDRRLNQHTFAGIGATVIRPEYSSGKTAIKSDDFSVALYGGASLAFNGELTGRMGYGHAQFRQSRGVQTERHLSEYGGQSFFAGLGLSRLLVSGSGGFCLRPGVQYDFLRMMTDRFLENDGGAYSLHMDNHTQNLHRVKAGIDLNWQPTRRFLATGEIYYLGIHGDRSAKTRARFVNDPGNAFEVTGRPIEQNNLGLGLQLRAPLGERWELGGGYTALIGGNTTSRQIAMNAVWKF